MALMLLAGLLAAFPSGVGAASYVVTNCNDTGPGSLRLAVGLANGNVGELNTIAFDLGQSCDTITLTSGYMDVSRNITIQGPVSSTLTVSGNNVSQVFRVASMATLTISHLTITGGLSAADGGAIHNRGTLVIANSIVKGSSAAYSGGGVFSEGTLTISNSRIRENTAEYGGGVVAAGPLTVAASRISDNVARDIGGGIYATGSTTISDSTFLDNKAAVHGGLYNIGTLEISGSLVSGNSAERGAGGIRNDGSLTISGSTIDQNSSGEFGGGVSNASVMEISASSVQYNMAVSGGGVANAGTLRVTNSTISSNYATALGGGLRNYGGSGMTLTSSTVSDNYAADGGGGIFNAGALTLAATIVALNRGGLDGLDVHGEVVDGGHNLIGNNSFLTGLSHGVNGNLVGTSASPLDPLLHQLWDNGGQTLTQRLLPGSPAIDRIQAGKCAVNVDQRGLTRPQGTRCDIGAYEVFAPLHYQACLYAGSLSQIRQVETMLAPVSCGRGTTIVLLGGGDPMQASHHACLFGGTLSQVGPAFPTNCGRGAPVSLALGTSLWACRYGGALSQVGVSQPQCGRGELVGLVSP